MANVLVLGLWLGLMEPSRPDGPDVLYAAGISTEGGFKKLIGRWVRPDGGYVLEIKNAEDNGRLGAAYYNPNPVHVARAEASREGSTIVVFIELRDVNYPGATYKLAYRPDEDQLTGEYYQPILRQTFNVMFVRASRQGSDK